MPRTPARRIKLHKIRGAQCLLIPPEFSIRGDQAFVRKQGARLIIEPAKPPSLLGLLAILPPLNEDVREIPDPPPRTASL